MKRKTLLHLLIFTLLCLGMLLGTWDARGFAQELETWTAVAPLPVPMGGGLVRCPEDPDGFYIVSGVMRKNVNSKWLYHYDITIATWERLKSMPDALRGGASACYQGKIYVAGGTDLKTVFNTLYIYDIATNKWSSGPTLPDPVYFPTFGVWDGKLYLVGGNGLTGLTGRVDVYDPGTGIWTAGGGASMLNPVGGVFHAQVGPYLYLVGGAGVEVNQTTTQRYDMSTDTWELGPTFTSQRAFGGLVATNGFLYALGGDIEDGEWAFHATDLVEVLNLATWPEGEWIDLGIPLPVPNLYPPTTCTETLAGGEIWDVGGGLTAYDTYTDVYYLPVGEGCP